MADEKPNREIVKVKAKNRILKWFFACLHEFSDANSVLYKKYYPANYRQKRSLFRFKMDNKGFFHIEQDLF